MSLPSPEDLRAAALRLPRLPAAPALAGPIAVAVSGGADSIYLLCALWADGSLRSRLRVLHFDHRVRGEASAEDARFVAAFCAALGVPCVTLRGNTERPVTVTDGTNVLAVSDPSLIHEAVEKILRGEGKRGRVPHLWDGKAAERTVEILAHALA